MEQKNRSLTWQWVIDEVNKRFDPSLKYYGIPRGGQYIAALLNPVDTPEEADILIDDIIDSGKTMKDWQTKYPDKPFVALIDDTNREPGEWIEFPWEQKGEIDIEDHVRRILQYFDDPNREGLKDTPKRYIKFLKEFLNTPDFNFTVFDAEGTDEMIVQTNIPFYSLCEHHLAPFFGYAHVAYIPNDKIVGLSKLSRTVDLYAHNFQNQERITTQIAERLQTELNAKGVAVVLTAQHLCMSMRGVRKHDTWTTTSKMLGEFHDDLNTRQEFLNFIKK
jgi:GTP cyclohydrolase I